MRTLLLLCFGALILGIFQLPIGYYTILRILVTIAAAIIVSKESKKGIGFWAIAFGIIAIIFNPIIPVYLHDKGPWVVVDLVCGVLFLIKSFTIKEKAST